MIAPRTTLQTVFLAVFVGISCAVLIFAVLLVLGWGSAEWSYVPRHPSGLDRVDLERVHAELLPEWIVAVQEGEGDRLREDLHRALGPDANLGELTDRLEAAVADPLGNAEELLYLSWAWSAYLDAEGEPWRVSGSVHLGPEGPEYRLKTYRVVADVGIEVAGHPQRTRLVTRVDQTDAVESFLGGKSHREDAAIVVVDRVSSLALDKIWTLLGPEAHRSPVQQAFHDAVRKGIVAALPPEDVEILTGTAAQRQTVVQITDAIQQRAPCSGFLLRPIPATGPGQLQLQRLRRTAAAHRDTVCPAVTEREAMALELLARELRQVDGLELAAARLVAWAARAVAVHEARHVADGPEWTCAACPVEGDAAAELSAYLAAFSHPEIGPAALYQACTQDLTRAGAHGVALATIFARLVPGGCEQPPPDQLAERARELQLEWLGESDEIRVPASFPRSLVAGR